MKKKTKILDLEARKELKSNKEVMDVMVADVSDIAIYAGNLERKVKELESTIEHLEKLLKDKPEEESELERKPIEEEIIMVELNRMHDLHVMRNCPITEKDDIKKLETLVKCIVSLRTGKTPKKKKEKAMSLDDALKVMKDEVNNG